MIQLKETELKAINAGAIKWGVLGLIGGAITFIIGVIDGFINPTRCRI